MCKIKLVLAILLWGLLALSGAASAQLAQGGAGTADPCSVYPHSSAPVTLAAAGTVSVVAPVTGQAIYVCGFTVVTQATSTAQLEYGTGATCGTGTTVLSGTILASTTWVTPSNATQVVTPITQRLCAVSTGATGAANGWVSYVQQ